MDGDHMEQINLNQLQVRALINGLQPKTPSKAQVSTTSTSFIETFHSVFNDSIESVIFTTKGLRKPSEKQVHFRISREEIDFREEEEYSKSHLVYDLQNKTFSIKKGPLSFLKEREFIEKIMNHIEQASQQNMLLFKEGRV